MKLLHVIGTLDPEYGGPVEGVRQMVRDGCSQGINFEIVTLDSPDAPWLPEYAVPVHTLGPAHLKYRYSARLKPWLAAHASDYDGILVNGIWQFHSFATWLALKTSATPYFVYVHGALDPWFKVRYPVKHFKKWLYWPWAEYRVLRDARAVIFTTIAERDNARKSFSLYQCREQVVSYGTKAPPANANLQIDDFQRSFPQTMGKRIVLFLSRIDPKKGCDIALSAFAEVSSRDPNLHLVIAGPDTVGWRVDLERQAKSLGITDHVTWTGMLDDSLKWGAFYAADCFFLPSHSENFGVVVAEALACKLPVLISDKVNIAREIEESNAGIVRPNTVVGATNALQEWLSISEPDRALMRENALRCFTEHLEMRKCLTALREFLRQHSKPPGTP